MKKLGQEGLQKARAFIVERGRELDRWFFEFHFEGGSGDAVLTALGDYQNEDGGFGRGIEPDLRMAGSSVLATTVGFQFLREVGAAGDHPMVGKGIEYFLATFDAGRQVWPIIPPEAESEPRAPWWNYEKSAEFFGNFLANPWAEIIGYLCDSVGQVPGDLLEKLTAAVVDHVESLPDEMDMHDMLCFVRLVETAGLGEAERERVLGKIVRAASHTVTKDPEKWKAYSSKPLWLAPRPDAPLAKVLAREVEMNLDFEIDYQGEDGSWSPFWSWGDQYPKAWEVAQREWQAKLTVDMLKSLQAFGRIEGMS